MHAGKQGSWAVHINRICTCNHVCMLDVIGVDTVAPLLNKAAVPCMRDASMGTLSPVWKRGQWKNHGVAYGSGRTNQAGG
eukprot:6114899-Prorocentrum_lima.AAC.1